MRQIWCAVRFVLHVVEKCSACQLNGVQIGNGACEIICFQKSRNRSVRVNWIVKAASVFALETFVNVEGYRKCCEVNIMWTRCFVCARSICMLFVQWQAFFEFATCLIPVPMLSTVVFGNFSHGTNVFAILLRDQVIQEIRWAQAKSRSWNFGRPSSWSKQPLLMWLQQLISPKQLT